MSVQIDALIQELLKNLEKENYVRPEEIPAIDLYMDQVTTFMDEHLSSSKRSEEDKILTKTMINNYAKNNLLPPPVKKKYSKNHILMMIYIYYFKGFLSISDIQSLLNPLTQNHFAEDSELPLDKLYEHLFSLEKKELIKIQKDLSEKYAISKNLFKGTKDEEFLQCFTLICMLSFDVYMKKQMIEKMIDQLLQTPDADEEKAAKKAEAKAAKAKSKTQKDAKKE